LRFGEDEQVKGKNQEVVLVLLLCVMLLMLYEDFYQNILATIVGGEQKRVGLFKSSRFTSQKQGGD
jgi:hypothetical protein